MTGAALIDVGTFAGGAFLWIFFEYVLHRFAFHEMKGVGIGSREHLNHHVHAQWTYGSTLILAWTGVVLAGWGWESLGAKLWSPHVGIALGAGWTVGYFFYEYHHRAAHVRAPRNRWEAWVRKSHFHHHFGHPLHNQGVTVPLWDIVFRTQDKPDVVRVPRRLAMPWLVDADGNVKPEFAADYELVGTDTTTDERRAALDKARAFANLEPVP